MGLAKWRVTCFYDTFVVKQTVVHLMNFGAKMPPHPLDLKDYLHLIYYYYYGGCKGV